MIDDREEVLHDLNRIGTAFLKLADIGTEFDIPSINTFHSGVRLIEGLRLSVDPAVAECDVHCLIPIDRRDAGLLLRIPHPDARRLRMVFAHPSFEVRGLLEQLHRVVGLRVHR